MVVDVTLYFLLPGTCQVVGMQSFQSLPEDQRLLDSTVMHWKKVNCAMNIEHTMQS